MEGLLEGFRFGKRLNNLTQSSEWNSNMVNIRADSWWSICKKKYWNGWVVREQMEILWGGRCRFFQFYEDGTSLWRINQPAII
jgi:hypothetical protein